MDQADRVARPRVSVEEDSPQRLDAAFRLRALKGTGPREARTVYDARAGIPLQPCKQRGDIAEADHRFGGSPGNALAIEQGQHARGAVTPSCAEQGFDLRVQIEALKLLRALSIGSGQVQVPALRNRIVGP